MMACAEPAVVPAGGALAVDREQFSVVIYNNTGRRDGLSQRLEDECELWRVYQ